MSVLSRRPASALGLVASIVLSLAATDASAQASGLAIDHFNPSERGSDWFAEDSLDLRGSLRPAVGVVGEYADRPLVIVSSSGSTVAAPVEDQLIFHLGGSLVLADRVRVAFDFPLAVYEAGSSGAVRTTTYPATDAGGIGDLRMGADLRLVGKYGDPFTLAFGVVFFLPTGSQGAYLSDGDARVLGRLAVAGQKGMFTYAGHVGFEVRPDDSAFPGDPTGSEAQIGGSFGVRLLERRLVVGPEVYGSTVVTSGSAVFSTRQTPVEGLLGAHYTFANDLRVGAGLGTGLTRGFGEPVVRAMLSFEWAPAYVPVVFDRDKDTIPDKEDACPDVAGVATDDPKTNGCPPPDRDHDGVPDKDDACPDVPGVKTDDPKTNGCPPDRDHDGVPDSEDKCIDTPGVHTDVKATDGCPPDSDKDGIPDAEDACPGVPGVRTTDPKTNGCPDPDRDQDGIPNAEDACPEVKGPRSGDPKRNGCPEAYIADDMVKVLDVVKFGAKGDLLLSDSGTMDALYAIAALLREHPEVKHVRIEGHTDNQGDAAAQHALSARRAAAVQAWLVKAKVPAARLTTMGVGGDSPVQDNSTEAGRKANERIELHIEP